MHGCEMYVRKYCWMINRGYSWELMYECFLFREQCGWIWWKVAYNIMIHDWLNWCISAEITWNHNTHLVLTKLWVTIAFIKPPLPSPCHNRTKGSPFVIPMESVTARIGRFNSQIANFIKESLWNTILHNNGRRTYGNISTC